jgi:NADP-reducing hydrogenase subunit HndB
MKSPEELANIREAMRKKLSRDGEDQSGARVVAGLATCGIAAGARPVLSAFKDEIAHRSLNSVSVTQTGCIGVCRLEPIVEIYKPGEEKVTYVKVTPDMVARIVTEHIVNNSPVSEYTIGFSE